MKKLLMVLVALVAVVSLAACGKKEYKLGMGVVVNASQAATGTAQVDSTVAVVVTDEDGKIVACRIDALQNKASITEGVLKSTNTTSKAELKENYNMSKYGHSLVGNEKVLEWYQQAQAFEAYVVGKTVEEVSKMEMQTMENGYVISKDQALLDAGCTIQVNEFIAALVKAGADEQGTTFTAKEFTLGVAINGELNSGSTAATADAAGSAALYSEYAAVVLVDGKIAATLNDAIQPTLAFNVDGTIGALTFKGTKRELKENYNMAKYGHSLVGNETVVEWYLQSATFSKHLVGMTSSEVASMPTQTMENGYVISKDAALLDAGCTMQITGMVAVVVDAISNAR